MATGGKARNASADLIKNPGKRAKSDLRGDTNFTQNQLDSIFANLGTTGRGVSRALDKAQERTLGAMNRLAARTRNSAYAKNDAVTQHLTNRYGTAMGSAINTQMKPAEKQAKATALDTVGGQQAAGLLAKGGQMGLKIEQAAAREARAGADYAMAAAYQDRAVALAEARLKAQQDKEDAAKTHLSDAQDSIQQLAAAGKTRGDAMRQVKSMQLRYNLNSKETKKLTDYVNSLYPEGEGAYVISDIAEDPLDANGRPLSVTMDDQDKELVRSKVAAAFAGGKTLDEALTIARNLWTNTEDGTVTGTAGFFEELSAYVTRMYGTLNDPNSPNPPDKTPAKPEPVKPASGGVGTAPKTQKEKEARAKLAGIGAGGATTSDLGTQVVPKSAPAGGAPGDPNNYRPTATYGEVQTSMDSAVRDKLNVSGGKLTETDIQSIMFDLYQRYGVHVLRSAVVRSAARYS